MPKADISFKKTSRDMKLYLTVMSHEERSEFVKDAIEFYEKYKSYEAEIVLHVKRLESENLDKKA